MLTSCGLDSMAVCKQSRVLCKGYPNSVRSAKSQSQYWGLILVHLLWLEWTGEVLLAAIATRLGSLSSTWCAA